MKAESLCPVSHPSPLDEELAQGNPGSLSPLQLDLTGTSRGPRYQTSVSRLLFSLLISTAHRYLSTSLTETGSSATTTSTLNTRRPGFTNNNLTPIKELVPNLIWMHSQTRRCDTRRRYSYLSVPPQTSTCRISDLFWRATQSSPRRVQVDYRTFHGNKRFYVAGHSCSSSFMYL